MSINLRIATFNLENLDDKAGEGPSLDERIAVMRPYLLRLNADIICFQEVNGQEEAGNPRRLLALQKLLEETPYSGYHLISTMTGNNPQVYDERNLVIVSRFEILEHSQYKHNFATAPQYRKVTAKPAEQDAKDISWERPILYAKIKLDETRSLHILNIHLKSKLPSDVEGQKINNYTWKTASGWAEGFFLSSVKRVGQALEARILVDNIFDQDEKSLIAACGDFNAESDEVPVEAIRGDVENTGNSTLAGRVLVPCEMTVPESSRYSLYHRGRGIMIDHLMVSRTLLAYYKGAEIHNELLHDESIAFATDKLYPESDHAPVIAKFEIAD